MLLGLVFVSTYAGHVGAIDLESSRRAVDAALQSIRTQWNVDAYPKFLKSAWMEKGSWDLMNLKLQHKILLSIIHSKNVESEKFVMSFTGSSVTAGHDSKYSEAFPSLINQTMYPILQSLNINLQVRNVAVGNNPCIPYDLCVGTFAGVDSDLVVWEQAYNCGMSSSKAILEHFIRESMLLPNKPIVVLSDSETTNWRKNQCPNPSIKHNVTDEERRLLDASTEHLTTVLNGPEYRKWSYVSDAIHAYPGAGTQAFTHKHHFDYRCQGPYADDWGAGTVRHHPSVLGHRLRADHHSYIWLSILAQAIAELQKATPTGTENAIDTLRSRLKNVEARLDDMQPWGRLFAHEEGGGVKALSKQLHQSVIGDQLQCFTDYEPRAQRESSLLGRVIGGKVSVTDVWGMLSADMKFSNGELVRLGTCQPSETNIHHSDSTSSSADVAAKTENLSLCWQSSVYEFIGGVHKPGMLMHILNKGYLDFKYVLHGTNTSGPLSIHIEVKHAGKILVCEPPGVTRDAAVEKAKLWRAFATPRPPGGSMSGSITASDNRTDHGPTTRSPLGLPGALSVVNHTAVGAFEFNPTADNVIELTYYHTKGLEICWQIEQTLPVGEFALTIEATTEHIFRIAYILVP
jgi:hypothetical protein